MDKTEEKRELDKFYTNREIVKKLTKEINFENYDLVIEPSAGDGAFVENIDHKKIVALDISPEAKGIRKKDWFKYKVPKKYKNVIVIGNPPFGKYNNLSSAFLKHAFSFENVSAVAFVLPNVYKKYTMQKYIPSNFYINKIMDIGNDAFTLNGEKYHVPCSFFIITKDPSVDLRQKVDIKSRDFEFGSKKDFDFFIFGAAPKKVIKKPEKNNRGYYIKAKIDTKELKDNFKNINWSGHSSANGGVYWLTKIDIIENYIKEMGR